jgi:hypothetical protein
MEPKKTTANEAEASFLIFPTGTEELFSLEDDLKMYGREKR